MSEKRAMRLPIVMIGGFLGAGKTTLVNALLADTQGRRFVVFVNDFGAINIDHALIKTVEQDRISLKNGCVCCSLNEDLVASISQFSSEQNPPDAIVIESSGVADPRALDSSFSLLESSGAAIVDTCIYVMDADGFGSFNYEDSELLIDHAAAADIVILNKCDIASEDKITSIETLLEEAAPYTSLLRAVDCDIPVQLILADQQSLRTQRRASKPTAAVQRRVNHGQKYQQWSHTADVRLCREQFLGFVQELTSHCLRAKGFIRFADSPDELVSFNLVGVRTSFEVLSRDSSEPTQLVLIGLREKMDADLFSRRFDEMQIKMPMMGAIRNG